MKLFNNHYVEVLENLWFNKLTTDKVFPIMFPAGMRGHSVCRILQAHQDINYSSLEVREDLCEYREFTSNTAYNWKMAHSSFHESNNRDVSLSTNNIVQYIQKKLYKNYLLFHLVPIGSWNPDTSMDELLVKLYYSSKQYIYLYGTVDRPYFNKCTYSSIDRPNVYNINIDDLFSRDYLTFETEYYKLINHFNLASRINAVRAFILLNLERQDIMKEYDTGYRQPEDVTTYINNQQLKNLFYISTYK